MIKMVEKGGLSGYALKYLAVFCMICDHTASFIIRGGLFKPWMTPEGGLDFSAAPAYLQTAQAAYQVLDALGRAAFPLFCFLLTEGFAHTRSRRRYLLTLLAFAVVTEPIYDWAHYGVAWNGALQNVLFTLSVCCGELWVLEGVRAHVAAGWRRCALLVVAVLTAGAVALAVRGEYVFLGTTSAALFYLLRERKCGRVLGLAPLLAVSPWVLLALPPLLAYNGRRGCRGWKYFFYVFYPLHFPLLVWIGHLCAKKF